MNMMPNPTTALRGLPAELRVRVKIADKDLPSLATGSDAPWSGVATSISAHQSKDAFGRSNNIEFNVRVPLSSLPGGVPPDNAKVGIMYPGEKAYTEWRIMPSRRTPGFIATLTLGPLNG